MTGSYSIARADDKADDQKGVSISVGYYDNFVRVVLDAYSQGMPAKKKVTSFKAVSAKSFLA